MNQSRLVRAFLVAVFSCYAIVGAGVAHATTLEPYEINAIVPLTGGGAFLGKGLP